MVPVMIFLGWSEQERDAEEDMILFVLVFLPALPHQQPFALIAQWLSLQFHANPRSSSILALKGLRMHHSSELHEAAPDS